MSSPYNPLDKTNLGRSVADALMLCPVSPLSKTSHLSGAGVYMIYYSGQFSAYRPIAQKNTNGKFDQPIYVGKAIPKGARKGGLHFDAAKGNAIRDRLRDHANSINQARNLELSDFHFRSLVVDDIWIPLGENMMIEKFKPIWNIVIDGFGNKTPGKRRFTQYRSQWDVLHPGRKFAEHLADSGVTSDFLIDKLAKYFAGEPVALIPAEQAADEGSAEDDSTGDNS
jgi:Eco29kI restriction endonuclease